MSRLFRVFIAVALWVSALAPVGWAQGVPPESDREQSERRQGFAEQIEAVRQDIALRRAALAADAVGDPQISALRRLLDVLQRGEEASRLSAQLEAGQEEASQRAERPASKYFNKEPPFAVPLLDAIFLSWEAQRAQRERLGTVVSDTRASLESARGSFEAAERKRRRARDEWEREGDAIRKAQRAVELREAEIGSRVARAERDLTEIALHNAELEYGMQQAAERQAAAALGWVREHLLPDEKDLSDIVADLEKRTFDLERALESTRLDLAAAAGQLESVRSRTESNLPGRADLRAAEVAAHRLAFTAAQRRVALLGERSQRLELAKQAWQRRYRVLTGDIEAEESRRWRTETKEHLDDISRQRRIEGARLAELEGDLAELRGRILADVTGRGGASGSDPTRDSNQEIQRWLRIQEQDFLALTKLYRTDIANLDEVLRLWTRLDDELRTYDEGLAVRERIARLGEVAGEVWAYEITSSEDRPITVGKVVTALIIFVIGMALARRLAGWVSGRVLSRFGFDPGVRSAFESLFFYAAVALIFLIALRTANIPLTAFAVLGGALALGIGFGSQAVVSNFISGLILLAERPIKLGDHVEVEGLYGVVERIGLRSTRIRTGDNFHIIVPNALFLERSVINWTHDTNIVRLKVAVGVAYGSPLRTVENALKGVAGAHTAVLEVPEPLVLFLDFADSALLFEVRFWIRVHDISDKLGIESQIRFAIDERFHAEGIAIAFPQRDLHIDAASVLPIKIERDTDV